MAKATGRLFSFLLLMTAGLFASAFVFFLKLSSPPAFSEPSAAASLFAGAASLEAAAASAPPPPAAPVDAVKDTVKKNILKLRKDFKKLLFGDKASDQPKKPGPAAPAAPPQDALALPDEAQEASPPAGQAQEAPLEGPPAAAPDAGEPFQGSADLPSSLPETAPDPADEGAANDSELPLEAQQEPEGEPSLPGDGAAIPPLGQKPELPPVSESLLELKSFMEPFLYDPSAKRRNPFHDPSQTLGPKRQSSGAKKRVIHSPLEKYPLKDIRLKGIIWNVEQPKALFQLPGGGSEFYTLLEGDRVGKFGVIKEITEDIVEIEEIIVRGEGGATEPEKKIQIKKMNRLRL